ncbi:MAG: hypothetical protein QXT05_02820, partial [Candidatus Bilamarchaeaceae archaeon]
MVKQIWDKLDRIYENSGKNGILAYAKLSKEKMSDVATWAVHWERFSNESTSSASKEIIIELFNLEMKKPKLTPDEPIANKLTGTLAGSVGIEAETETEKNIREERKKIAIELFERLMDISAIKLVRPLIGALQDESRRESVKELLDKMKKKKLGKADEETMKEIGAIITGALTTDADRQYAEDFCEKIIDEKANPIIYLVRP